MSWTVYEHITPSGKRYIGITIRKNPNNRWRDGKGYRKDTPFGKAIEKYKWENIQHNIVSTDLTEKEAKWLENYLICYYWTFVGFKDCKGYNCTLGGDGTVGVIRSEEQKEKISKSLKGKYKGENNPCYGRKHTEEECIKMSEANKGRTPWIKGKHHTEESNKKNSEAHKGQIPWNKGKTGVQVAWNKGIPMSEDAKRKNRESHKGKPGPNKGIPMSEDAKRKNRDSHKGTHRVYHEDGTFHMER